MRAILLSVAWRETARVVAARLRWVTCRGTGVCGHKCRVNYMKANQSYTREFKRELIRRIVVGGEGLAAVARSVDLDEKTVARWRREYARDPENAFARSRSG